MIKEKNFIKIASKAIGSKVTLKSNIENTKKWDSLAHLQLLAALDKNTNGKTSKISSLTNAKSIIKIFNILKDHKLIND